MTWLLIFAALVVLLVAGAVLPRRAEYRVRGGTPGFPWFWIVFPLTALAVALAFASWLPGVMSSGAYSGWTMYAPLADADENPTSTFFSDSAALYLLGGWWARVGYPVLAIVGIGLSTWAWRRNRV